jgi:hypothetical protein
MKAESIPSINHHLPNELQTNRQLLLLAGRWSTSPYTSLGVCCEPTCGRSDTRLQLRKNNPPLLRGVNLFFAKLLGEDHF